jgi:hypothetical protein
MRRQPAHARGRGARPATSQISLGEDPERRCDNFRTPESFKPGSFQGYIYRASVATNRQVLTQLRDRRSRPVAMQHRPERAHAARAEK